MEINEASPEYKRNERYTYADYCSWDDGERWEIIDGEAYAMSPAPLREHQSISAKLVTQIGLFLKGKTCEVFAAPFDVRLNVGRGDDTVVQPDILIVCDKTKFDPEGKGVVGAPDLIIEILSPSTEKRDRKIKFKAYQQAGVREYWIVDPVNRMVAANVLSSGRYLTHSYFDDEKAPLLVLEGCIIDLPEVFAE